MKPKLLVLELWGLGDLLIAAPFLQAAVERFDVTLVAKPFAEELQARCWPSVRVIPFIAPWTAFKGKYHLWAWSWVRLGGLVGQLRSVRFDFGVSARWDPRDHWLLWQGGCARRLAFPRLGSQVFLTNPLTRPGPLAHRYEFWRELATGLGFPLPAMASQVADKRARRGPLLVHTGAARTVRVWPLERYAALVQRLRTEGHAVRVACDPNQTAWWRAHGEPEVVTPPTVSALLEFVDNGGAFLGNDSGPGHLAAFCGVPTFTLFGPQVPEWFMPLHPQAQSLEGKACPYKPCFDYCRFPTPLCLERLTVEEVWRALTTWLTGLAPGR